MYDGLSCEMQCKIERFKTASFIADDLSSMWAGVQTNEMKDPLADGNAMRQLVEDCIMKRISQYYLIRADLGTEILKLGQQEGLLDVLKNKLTKREIIDATETLINNLDMKKSLSGFGSFVRNLFGGKNGGLG
jgi:hypothetical protein